MPAPMVLGRTMSWIVISDLRVTERVTKEHHKKL